MFRGRYKLYLPYLKGSRTLLFLSLLAAIVFAAANAFGLHDTAGNVWEWTTSQPEGGEPTNVIKGGSFLCAANYCARYRPAARQFQERGLGTDHIGFRLIDTRRSPPG